jgi:hypothetical protein
MAACNRTLTQVNFGEMLICAEAGHPRADSKPRAIRPMNTLVTYLIEFALIWTALMLAWRLTRMTVRIIRSERKPEK